MTLFELLHGSAVSALAIQDASAGNMPGGHNGPYHDPELPARNTAHWIITFLKAHEISGERRFLDAAGRAVRYLTGTYVRPHGKTFWHRTKAGKDSCNGVIGQAWTIEALVAAAPVLAMPELIRLSEEVFLLHPFDEDLGIWQRVEVDGTILPFDTTFNHQLWFATSGALLARSGSGEVDRRVRRFLDVLTERFDTFPSGLIWHPLAVRRGTGERFTEYLRRARQQMNSRGKVFQKALGYHSFNLYGFALLNGQYPDHPFWRSRRFGAVWRYALSPAYRRGLETNTYGYPYNPPGIEMAFALEVFGRGEKRADQEWWISEQMRRCYDPAARMMSRGTEDPLTHAARLYEATRLTDLEVTLTP